MQFALVADYGKLCAMEAFLIFVPILMISQLTNYPDSRDN